jgi:UDP-GlcNAc:undecaprenyl-phosphate/decaprenyl-phosphate GlcNAc-1-phosphate transferase
MIQFLPIALTAFAASFILLPFIIRFSKKKNLLAAPGKRRIHKMMKPSLGGAAIFAGFTFATLIWIDSTQWTAKYFLVPILIIPFVLGLVDDLTHLKPVAKIIGQTITASLIFFTLDIRVHSLYGIFPNYELPLVLSYGATVALVIFITNSFNLIDGIDGLAALFSLLAIALFGVWFFLVGDTLMAIFCTAFSGAILAFLLHNWEPSRIFMGDTGSLVIGTMLAILTIEFLNINRALSLESDFKFLSPVAAVICILVIPIVDTLRVIIIRLSRRISPFKPDKRHLHHTLVRLGKSHRFAVILLSSVHLFFIMLALLLQKITHWLALPAVIFFSFCFVFALDYIFHKHTLSRPNSSMGTNS